MKPAYKPVYFGYNKHMSSFTIIWTKVELDLLGVLQTRQNIAEILSHN